jgi:hypothetical protein
MTGKVITALGVKPIVPVQWQRDNFWLYGAVEPLTVRSTLRRVGKIISNN